MRGTIRPGVSRRENGPVAVARRWWPVPVVVVSSFLVQKLVFESRYDVAGHAAGHLSSASAPFGAFVMVAVLLWTTPAGRRQLDVVAACAAWLIATVLVLVGNVRVVDDLVDAGLGTAPAEGLPDVADHGLANVAPWLGALAAVVMAGVFWRRGHISQNVAIGSALVSVFFPPWIIPGAGVLVLVVARANSYERSSRTRVRTRNS